MARLPLFERRLDDVTTEDLTRLAAVSEGWYVEFKRQVPDAGSVAKSISAFANHFGGWVFYGVEDEQARRNGAAPFPGVPAAEVPVLLARIRDAARVQISPTPFFELRAIEGPADTIGLPAGRAIIVVDVSEGANAPYIHGSGRIYRRVADASDPKHETDRSVLDVLVERTRRKREGLAEILRRTPRLSEDESKMSYLQLFLLADPLGDRGCSTTLTFAEFATIMAAGDTRSGGMPFDTAHPSAAGYVARMVGRNEGLRRLLAWDHNPDGSSVVTIPFRTMSLFETNGYYQTQRFTRLCGAKKIGPEYKRVLDLNLLPWVIGGCIKKHWALTAAGGVPGPFYAKVHAVNVWRRIPFLDTAAFIAYIESHGVPVIQDEDAFAPPGVTVESLLEVASGPTEDERDEVVTRIGLEILAEVFVALGLPWQVIADAEDFFNAVARGSRVYAGVPGHS